MRRRLKPGREAGYNLVILVVMVTLMTIAVAVVLPLWSSVAQRDREEELIFRGLQYAEAVRCFQRRFGRYPVRLQELLEVKPRCIRQLYPDPMSEDGEWGLIYAGGPGTQVRPGQNPNQAPGRQPPNGLTARPDPDPQDQGDQDSVNGLPVSRGSERTRGGLGPILGVHSKSDEESIKVFMGRTNYDQWAFTADMVSGIAQAPGQPPIVPSARTLGRPFPEGIQPQISFAQPQKGGQGPDQIPGQNPGAGGGQGAQNVGGFGVPQPPPVSRPQRPGRRGGGGGAR